MSSKSSKHGARGKILGVQKSRKWEKKGFKRGLFGVAEGLFGGAEDLFGCARHPFAPPWLCAWRKFKKKSFYVNYPLSVIRYPVPDNYRIIRLSGTGLSGKFTGLSGSGRIVICAPVTPLVSAWVLGSSSIDTDSE